MFGPDLAEVYDLVYRSRGQDFAAEAAAVARLVRERRPDASSLLDVGCGTGEHLRWLYELFDRVEGLDLSAPMVSVARQKLPAVDIHLGDMRDFDLGRTFDAVISLSTAVAYLPSPADLDTALCAMARHLAPDGVLVIEPWYFPERFLDGFIASDVLRDGDRTIARVSRTSGQPGAARIDSHYVVADPAGIRHFTESQVFGLWPCERYLEAFRAAGCTATYLEGVQSGRGLFVGRRA